MFLTANCPFHKSERLIEVISLISRSVLRDLLTILCLGTLATSRYVAGGWPLNSSMGDGAVLGHLF